jgi:glycosyltransferase involved in cell wall biosynthesis
VKILLVSQMYPGPDDPDLGAFVAQIERALRARGHDIERAVIDRRAGGKRRYARLARKTYAAARRFQPDVVYAHFLAPAGVIAALASRAPLVLTAHGRDVRNIGSVPAIATATRFAVRRAAAVIAVSDYLRRELETKLPDARGKTYVVDAGVDLARYRPLDRPAEPPPPAFLFVGALTERKNVVRLARAFERLGEGTLTYVGDGPLRPQLEGRRGVRLAGAVAHDEIPARLAASDVLCQPSLIEPFGQALLEAMACARSVVATRIGGPPEFVTADAGVLVDPLDEAAIADAMRRAAALGTPNPPAREAAAAHDVNAQAGRIEEILERAANEAKRRER